MIKAPKPNNPSKYRSGSVPGLAAKAILHPQGQYSNHVPVKLIAH